MAKKFTREELVAMGMDDQQIAAILATYAQSELIPLAQEVAAAPAPVVEQPKEPEKPLEVTNIIDIQNYAKGSLVQLPDFGPGQPFVARLRRPSLLVMTKSGKIPNTLIEQATNLFAKGAESMTGANKNTLGEMCDIIDVIVEAALIEPTIKQIHDVGMELTDEQKMAIFSYSQSGVKALEQFRTK